MTRKGLNLFDYLKLFAGRCSREARYPHAHRGEGSVYREKPPPSKQMPGLPGSGPHQSSAGRAPSSRRVIEKQPELIPPSQAMPDPQRMKAAQPPPPPPLPGSGFGDGETMPTQSELAKKLAEAQDTHFLAAHRIVDKLRATLTGIANLAESAKHCQTPLVQGQLLSMARQGLANPQWSLGRR